MSPVWLRIIQINDVYELDEFPNFRTLVNEHSKGSDDSNDSPDCVLVILVGDFVAPSLLSSLDKGVGMVDCMNAIGITHVCFGNHETDIGDALKDRIQQSKFKWINTNMRDYDEKVGVETLPAEIIEITNKENVTRTVCLLGLLTEDPSLYRPDSFSGATIEPVVPATERALEEYGDNDKIDLIIPLTHQGIAYDRTFAKKFASHFPVILGGHDHEPFDETVDGARIIKAGMDAHLAAVIDMKWSEGDRKPDVAVQMLKTADFAPDPAVAQLVQAHQKILTELERAPLFRISNWTGPRIIDHLGLTNDLFFSTKNNRLGLSTGTTALCSALRMGMRCHCAIINAGNIRANQVYDDVDFFTWSDLKAEVPFPMKMIAVYIPGRVLEETIDHSRVGSYQSPPVASGGYLHTCNLLQFSDDKRCIESINGKPFDPDKLYLTALPVQFFEGIDNHEPLLRWAVESKLAFDDDCAIPAKMILVETFSAALWLRMGSFEDIDLDHDGLITRDEVKKRVLAVFGQDVVDLVLDTIFSIADMNGDGVITPLEMCLVEFAATDLFSHVATKEELGVMKDIVKNVLSENPSQEEIKQLVAKIRDTIDEDGDGRIRREEVMQSFGDLKDKDLLT